jgi:hypothetical protein
LIHQIAAGLFPEEREAEGPQFAAPMVSGGLVEQNGWGKEFESRVILVFRQVVLQIQTYNSSFTLQRSR